MKYESQNKLAQEFYELHHNDKMLILPNIWDGLGAAMLEDMGYQAVATSSSAVALTQGYRDGENMPFSDLINLLKRISSAVNIPVTADIESAFASDDKTLINNIKKLIDTGICGINYEDSDKISGELIPVETQGKNIEIIRDTAESMGVRLFINARVDTYVHADHLSHDERIKETISRAKVYKDAGADCIFPILMTDRTHIAELLSAVDLPLNIMAYKGIPPIEELKSLGVSRLSLGGSFLKVAIKAMKDKAEELLDGDGLDTVLHNDVTSDYLNKLVSA